ncbi:MAG: GNAT family N-acetyltransferase [Propionibacteriaceae bacterium]|nr:GNAT family N-acetyltransferase [Propionibacteriaceae bacterium]
MTGRSRTAIRQARKHGLTAQVVALDASISRPDHAFRYLYDLSMRRLHAGQEYFFSDDYFHRCFEVLGDCTRLAVVKDAEATIVAAALLFVDGERLHYHLSASNLGAAHRGANNLLLWTAAEWGNQKGLKWFHLGGGTRPNDSLFSFKASFGGQRCHYLVGTVIVDSDRYHALTAERAHSLGCEVTDLLATKYFPAYRVPRTMIEGVNVESFYS